MLRAARCQILARLTPHGLRHGHQTCMEEAGICDLLGSERMGHQLPGMRGVCGHVSPALRAGLEAVAQERWQTSLREESGSRLARSSPLDAPAIGSPRPRSAPKIGHRRSRNRDKRTRPSQHGRVSGR